MARGGTPSGETKEAPPFYERRSFQGTVAVVGLLAAVWGLLGAPPPWKIVQELSEADLARSNTEIVLDTSTAMGDSFTDGETKLGAAIHAIRAGGARNDEGLGLRLTNPDCESEERPLIDVGKHHVEAVRGAAEKLKPEGKSNITGAVAEALAEFRANPDFNRPGSVRRVVVYTSGHDDCPGDGLSKEIEVDLELTHEATSFTLIALRPSEADSRQLNALESALDSAGAVAETVHAESPEELEEATAQADSETEQAVEEAKQEETEEKTVSG
jgi:hypothetical protein